MNLLTRLGRSLSFLKAAALSTILFSSSLLAQEKSQNDPDQDESTYFHLSVRDNKGMPVDFELSPYQTYTAELWGGKNWGSRLPTVNVEGEIRASDALQVKEALRPDSLYVVRGFQQDFFSPRDEDVVSVDAYTVVNQFEGSHFSRSLIVKDASKSYLPRSLGYEGLVAIYPFKVETNALQHVYLDARITSHFFDGSSMKRDSVFVAPSHFFIVPEPRPMKTKLLIYSFGQGFPRLFAPGHGTPLTLECAFQLEGPWKDITTSRVHTDNPYGNLKYVDYRTGLPVRFFRIKE